MKKICTLISLLIVPLIYLNAQNIEFTRENCRNDKSLNKINKELVKKGDRYYFGEERGYLVALEYYVMTFEKHPNSALLNYKIADCYLHTLYKYRALSYAIRAKELNPDVMYDIEYVLGMAHHQKSNFDLAIEHYQNFKINYSGTNMDSLGAATKKIQECYSGKELYKEETYRVKNLGSVINTEYAEFAPLIKSDGSYMLYTARKPINLKDTLKKPNRKIKGEVLAGYDYDYFEDIYRTDLQNDNSWSTPYRFDYSTERKTIHDASVSLSSDGLTIFNYRSVNKGDLYYSTIINEEWQAEKPLAGINSKYRESHVSMAYDNTTTYFVSDRPGGYGGKDIWKASKLANEEWGNIENLGAAINTPYEEDAVFIHPDGKTLYFSSQGHNTMGGYDIFESQLNNGEWTAPINLGYPVNSPDDDIFFILTADGKHAYLSSVKETGYGMQDIYVITPFEKQEKREFDVEVFKGNVIDSDTKKGLNAKVEVVDNSTGVVMFASMVDAKRGFLISLPTGNYGKNYGIAVETEGYLFYSENFDLVKIPGYKEFSKTIEMEKVKTGSILVLRNIFFDFDQSNLKPASTTELDRALKYLAKYPETNINIEGYTDNVGEEDYNQLLSERRAHAVTEYLVARGFDTRRIKLTIGYGEANPVETNETDDGRAQNRRVIFRIVE
jgi:outer membrane protein OmpA-like peptidoglycan-associated protein